MVKQPLTSKLYFQTIVLLHLHHYNLQSLVSIYLSSLNTFPGKMFLFSCNWVSILPEFKKDDFSVTLWRLILGHCFRSYQHVCPAAYGVAEQCPWGCWRLLGPLLSLGCWRKSSLRKSVSRICLKLENEPSQWVCKAERKGGRKSLKHKATIQAI